MSEDSERVTYYAQCLLYGKQLNARDKARLRTLADDVRHRVASWRFDRYHNWGLQVPTSVPPYDLGDGIDAVLSLKHVLLEENWFYATSDVVVRRDIIQRILAVDSNHLLHLLEQIIARLYGNNTVDSVSLYGGYLYGHPSIPPEDIDLIVVLADGAIIENNVTVVAPALHKVFKDGTERLVSSGKLGLSVFSRSLCCPGTRNEDVLASACQEKGAGILLFGKGMSDVPVPLPVIVYKVVPLLSWGYKHTLYNDCRFMATGLSRVVEANKILTFLAEKLEVSGLVELTSEEQIWEYALMQPSPSLQEFRSYYIAESQKAATAMRRVHRVLRGKALARLEEIL
jgi:hypothetical protein